MNFIKGDWGRQSLPANSEEKLKAHEGKLLNIRSAVGNMHKPLMRLKRFLPSIKTRFAQETKLRFGKFA